MNSKLLGACLIAGVGVAILVAAPVAAREPARTSDGSKAADHRPPPPLFWVGTATEGRDHHPAGMFLMPPPPGERPPAGAKPEHPPGELRIGDRVMLLRPGQAQTAFARGVKVLRKLQAELLRPADGEPAPVGTLALSIDPDPATGRGVVSGTARIRDPETGQDHAFALSATLPPPHPPAPSGNR